MVTLYRLLFSTSPDLDHYPKKRRRNDDMVKNRREAYLEFLKALVPLLETKKSEHDATVFQSARLKLIQVEIDGSNHASTVAALLLNDLESKSKGIRWSAYNPVPAYRKYLLELATSEIEGRKPELDVIVDELCEDPFWAMMYRRRRSGSVQVAAHTVTQEKPAAIG